MFEAQTTATRDQLLLDAARAGDCGAFSELYARYRCALRSHCTRLTGDADAAEDLVQETFLRAWTHIHTFEVGRPIWPWLVRIAQRLSIDRWRAEGKVQAVEESLRRVRLPDAVDNIESLRQVIDERTQIGKALSTLNARYRRLFLLHALEGWSYKDIAAVEGSTVTSVGKVLNRARMRMRAVWEEEAS